MQKRVQLARLMLFFVLPLLILPILGCADPVSADLSSCDYFAMTDAKGGEYVYAPGEAGFEQAVDAFATAKKTDTPPTWLDGAGVPLLLEWIRDGHARQYSLYLSPSSLSAYMTDADQNGYALTEAAIAHFLASEAASPSLVGAYPPTVLVGGREVPFAVCQWTYSGTLDGRPFSVASAEYLHTPVEDRPITPATFALTFAETPKSTVYTLYRGADELASGNTPPPLAPLPAGNYQLVLVAEWQKGNTTTRAGYSFVFEII